MEQVIQFFQTHSHWFVAITALICGQAIDRARGAGAYSYGNGDWYMSFVFSVLIVWMFNIPEWFVVPLAFLYKLGETKGWGEPIGAYLRHEPMRPAHYESWQTIKILQENTIVALIFRGFMWGAPMAVGLWFFDPYLAAAVMVGFVPCLYLGCLFADTFKDWTITQQHGQWGVMEEIRGLFSMIPIVAYYLFPNEIVSFINTHII